VRSHVTSITITIIKKTKMVIEGEDVEKWKFSNFFGGM
jgi:hypothetical protein